MMQYVTQIDFSELDTLSADRIAEIKRKGSVVVHGVVPSETALQWKEELQKIVAENPNVVGVCAASLLTHANLCFRNTRG